MNKYIKTILIILVIILAIFSSYITFDSIRLWNSSRGTKPLITLETYKMEDRVIYTGIGYSMVYYVDMAEEDNYDETTLIEISGYGAEFKLFDKIIIWALVE